MTPPTSEGDRWASLQTSGHMLTPEQQLIMDRIVENSARARKKLQERWTAEQAADQDST